MSSSTPPPSSTESPEMEKSRPTNGTTKEKESSVSRAFEPRKQSGVNEAWIKERQKSAEQEFSPFAYTPFKSKPSRGTTPQPPNVEKAQTLPANNTASSGQNSTLRGSKGQHSPFTFHPPQAQSTPKAQHNNQIKKTPSYQPREGLVWPRVQMPQMGGYRAASAMGGGLPAGCRPASRASEVALGHCVGSRYQSYCTLPRPEQFDPLDAEMAFAAAAAFPGDAFRPPPNRVISRPPSALPVLGGDFIRAPAIYPAAEHAVESRMSVAGARPIISWGTLSILGSLQILVGLMIFCLGLARHFMRAKWAIGVELAFSLLVVLAGVTGLMASRRRSPSFASASFAFTASSLVFAVFPFVLGLFPTLSWSFPSLDSSIFVSENEPVDVDLALSAFVLVSVLLSLAVSVLACRSAGRAFSYVDKLRLAAEVNAVYEEKPTKKM